MSKPIVIDKVDWKGLSNRNKSAKDIALMKMKNEIVADTHKYVPRDPTQRGGSLRASGQRSVYTNKPEIIYNPKSKRGYGYARKMYEGTMYRFRTLGTRAKWFEYSKMLNKNKWLRNVRRIYGNKFNRFN